MGGSARQRGGRLKLLKKQVLERVMEWTRSPDPGGGGNNFMDVSRANPGGARNIGGGKKPGGGILKPAAALQVVFESRGWCDTTCFRNGAITRPSK